MAGSIIKLWNNKEFGFQMSNESCIEIGAWNDRIEIDG
jgi:hypothetical protein